MDASNSIIWTEGEWKQGNTPVIPLSSNGFWLASTVFDGARSFEGVAPDLDLHCQRAIRSAIAMGMKPECDWKYIYELAWQGIRRLPADAVLYIKPLFWADDGFIAPDPDSTRFAICIYELPFPDVAGFSAMLSSFRRPSEEVAPTNAKAACLYPNAGRAIQEARDAGFDNAVMCDGLGNIAEFATANLFYVKDGIVKTPAPNGSFLNGITRQRVIGLLHANGVEVQECRVLPADLEEADEIFNTGNYAKVQSVLRYHGRDLPVGPMATLSRELYWAYALSEGAYVK